MLNLASNVCSTTRRVNSLVVILGACGFAFGPRFFAFIIHLTKQKSFSSEQAPRTGPLVSQGEETDRKIVFALIARSDVGKLAGAQQ